MANDFDAPQSRNEAILQNILGADNVLGEPQSRIEALLMQILEQGGTGGGASLSDETPQMNGTAAAGSSTKAARGDHVHPCDTSRSPVLKYTTITLATTDWSTSGTSYACSKTVTGMTATSVVWVRFSDAYSKDADVLITTSQSANALTFRTDDLPDVAIYAHVAFVEGSPLT